MPILAPSRRGKPLMTSSIRTGPLLVSLAAVLAVHGGRVPPARGARGTEGPGCQPSRQDADRLRCADRDAPDREGAGRDAAGARRRRGTAPGPTPGAGGRVPLVCQRGVRLDLPPRRPLRRGGRPTPRLGAGARRGLERPLCRRPVRAGRPARCAGRPFPGRPPRQAGRDRDRHGGPLGEGPRGGPLQDARGAPRRVPGRGAGRRVPGRRLRRLVSARASPARAAARDRVRAPRALEHGRGRARRGCATPGRDQPGPGGRSPSRGSSGRSMPTTACRSASRSPGTARQEIAPDTWRRIRRPQGAGRQHGPRQPPLFQRQGRSTRFRRGAGAGPGRAAPRQAPHRVARHPARDRGGATARARVRPRLRRGRGRQRRRGRRRARGEGHLLAALLRDRLRARRPQGRASRRVAGGAQGGEVAAPGDGGRLGRRLPAPPARATSAACSATSSPRSRPSTTATSTSPISGPTWAGPCTPPRTSTWSSSPATCRKTTGTSRSPWSGETTSSSGTSTRPSTP